MGWKEVSASSRPRWEIATEPSVRKQSESPSEMWKRRAGDKLFLPSSFAVPINTMPVTVEHGGSTRTQRLMSALFSPTSWTRCMHREASGTAPNSSSNTVSQRSAFGIQKPAKFRIPVWLMCHPFISIVILFRTGLTLPLASFVFSIISKQIFHFRESCTALQPKPAREKERWISKAIKENKTRERTGLFLGTHQPSTMLPESFFIEDDKQIKSLHS